MSEHSYIQLDLKPMLNFDGYTLSHLGKSSAHGEIYVPNHVHHKFYELTVVTKGKGISYMGSVPYPIKAGDIFVSFPFEKHRLDSDPVDFMSYSFICFDVTMPKFSGRLNKLWLDHIPPEDRIIHCDIMASLIDILICEIKAGKGKYFEELGSAILEQITIHLIRGFEDRVPYSLSPNPSEDELCKHISHYIDTHLFTMKNLYECADALSYNYCYLTTVFKKITGSSLSDYYIGKKLDMSKVLIEEKVYSLSETAELLGYSGISSFSKAFSKRFGISPRDFAKNKETK